LIYRLGGRLWRSRKGRICRPLQEIQPIRADLGSGGMRPGGTDAPCVVPSRPGADRGLVGTTVGYLLSAHLHPDGIEATVATSAARVLDGALRHAPTRSSVIERLTVGRISGLRPWARELPEDERIVLARLAGILARFEQFFRAGPVVSSQELIDLLAGRPEPPVEHWRGEFAGLLASRTPRRAAAIMPDRTRRLVTRRTSLRKALKIGRFWA
jgi:hypothetical protein